MSKMSPLVHEMSPQTLRRITEVARQHGAAVYYDTYTLKDGTKSRYVHIRASTVQPLWWTERAILADVWKGPIGSILQELDGVDCWQTYESGPYRRPCLRIRYRKGGWS